MLVSRHTSLHIFLLTQVGKTVYYLLLSLQKLKHLQKSHVENYPKQNNAEGNPIFFFNEKTDHHPIEACPPPPKRFFAYKFSAYISSRLA